MTPYSAFSYACDNHTKPGFDLEYYQEIACKSPDTAYYFALRIPGANIEYCQLYVGTNFQYTLWFAEMIAGANIEYCRKTFEHDEYWLDKFDKMIIEKVML